MPGFLLTFSTATKNKLTRAARTPRRRQLTSFAEKVLDGEEESLLRLVQQTPTSARPGNLQKGRRSVTAA